jgi:hypothetical protein
MGSHNSEGMGYIVCYRVRWAGIWGSIAREALLLTVVNSEAFVGPRVVHRSNMLKVSGSRGTVMRSRNALSRTDGAPAFPCFCSLDERTLRRRLQPQLSHLSAAQPQLRRCRAHTGKLRLAPLLLPLPPSTYKVPNLQAYVPAGDSFLWLEGDPLDATEEFPANCGRMSSNSRTTYVGEPSLAGYFKALQQQASLS